MRLGDSRVVRASASAAAVLLMAAACNEAPNGTQVVADSTRTDTTTNPGTPSQVLADRSPTPGSIRGWCVRRRGRVAWSIHGDRNSP